MLEIKSFSAFIPANSFLIDRIFKPLKINGLQLMGRHFKSRVERLSAMFHRIVAPAALWPFFPVQVPKSVVEKQPHPWNIQQLHRCTKTVKTGDKAPYFFHTPPPKIGRPSAVVGKMVERRGKVPELSPSFRCRKFPYQKDLTALSPFPQPLLRRLLIFINLDSLVFNPVCFPPNGRNAP